MYGLMKAHICSRHQEAAHPYRLHYCGTCKTIGSLYGQKARFLLNYDTVFLAELLTTLAANAQENPAWSAAYQSYNCFALPQSAAEMPLPLQVAAAATLLMTEFKVADQITDGGSAAWKLGRKLLTPEFERAAAQMTAWNFPLEELWRWGAVQNARETAARHQAVAKTPVNTNTEAASMEVLADVTEPTARVTGLVFQHSGAVVGCSLPIQERLYALGFAFGSLVYVLDALEDYTKDSRQDAFNALQAAFALPAGPLPDRFHSLTLAHLQELGRCVESALEALPLPPQQATQFVSRLRVNLRDRLGVDMGQAVRIEDDRETGREPLRSGTLSREQAASGVCAVPSPRPSLRAQGQAALVQARALTARYRQQSATPWSARLAAPGVFGAVLTISFLFPEPAKTAMSYQECRDIACNLIFVGAALRRWNEAIARWIPARPAFALAGGTGAGILLSSETTSSSSESLTRSGSEATALTVKKKRRNPCCGSCCENVDCCCCACEGIECCSDCGDCCSSCS